MNQLPPRTPPFLPITSRQQGGNFISVRQKPDQAAGWGTLNRPKRFEMPLLGRHSLWTRLGFEAMPSSEVWAFHTPCRLQLQVERISEDRAANCVGVALLNAANQRVAPLVQSARGRGEFVVIAPGEYRIIASLGIAEEVRLELVLHVMPATGLLGVLPLTANGRGQLRRGGLLTGTAQLHGGGTAQLLGVAVGLRGKGISRTQGRGTLRQDALSGFALAECTARGALQGVNPSPLLGSAGIRMTAAAALAAVTWLEEPAQAWRARRTATGLELNRSYFSSDASRARQQLVAAGV